MANLFTYFDGALPRLFTEISVLKNIFKRGYEEIRDRKLLEILKRTGHGSNTNYIVMSKRRPHFFSKII